MESALYFTPQEKYDYDEEQDRVAQIRHKMQQILQVTLQSDARFAEQKNQENMRHANKMAELKVAEMELIRNM